MDEHYHNPTFLFAKAFKALESLKTGIDQKKLKVFKDSSCDDAAPGFLCLLIRLVKIVVW